MIIKLPWVESFDTLIIKIVMNWEYENVRLKNER